MTDIFNTAYAALPAGAARLYRLLAAHPGPDVDADLAAAAAETSRNEALRLLEVLAEAHLLQERGHDGRFGFGDLARRHAQTKLETETAADQRAVFVRIADWLLSAAVCAQLTLSPDRPYVGDYFHELRVELDFADDLAALEWQEAQARNLMAVQARAHAMGLHEIACQIAEAMWGRFLLRKHYRDWEDSHQTGLAAARGCGDLKAEGRMLEGLAALANNRFDFAAAFDYATQAVAVEEQAGHPEGKASALDMLGVAEMCLGRFEAATRCFTQSRDIYLRIGGPRGAALMVRHLGEVAARTGRYDEAITHFTRALDYFDAHAEHYHTARALTARGTAYLEAGQLDTAERDLDRSLSITQQIGARHEEGNVHLALSRLAAQQGQPDHERDLLERALAIYTDLGAPQAHKIAEQLAEPGGDQ